jgi:plastocyanin
VNAQSHRSLAFPVAALALLFWSAGAISAVEPGKSAAHTIAIDGTSFQPPMLAVKVGESVTWVNKDPFPHTVTSAAGGFDSHEIAPGKSWKYVATKKGEFPYICVFHPTMKATLRVE